MPTQEYETRTDSVLAWKKAQKLGRFDPNAPTMEQQKIQAFEKEIEERGESQACIFLSKICGNTASDVLGLWLWKTDMRTTIWLRILLHTQQLLVDFSHYLPSSAHGVVRHFSPSTSRANICTLINNNNGTMFNHHPIRRLYRHHSA